MPKTKSELLEELKFQGIKPEILKAIERIDRKDFLPVSMQKYAYENTPLDIGFKQTISQPYTVAFMLQELEIKEGDKVLEIGTGSAWNAALISYLIGKNGFLYTTEIVHELAKTAKEKLKTNKNTHVLNIDASSGLAEHAPFDRIILTAAPEKLNENLKNQLKEGGILLAPVGRPYQRMTKIKRKKNRFIEKDLGEFIFVPLVSE